MSSRRLTFVCAAAIGDARAESRHVDRAGYLLYLVWQAFRAPTGIEQTSSRETMSARQTYLRGVIMNVTNDAEMGRLHSE